MRNDLFDNAKILRRIISVHSIFGLGSFSVSKQTASRIKYPAFCLLFCDKGEAEIECGGKTTRLLGDNAIFIEPNAEFSAFAKTGDIKAFYAVFSVKENSISLFCNKAIAVSPFAKSMLAKLAKLSSEYFEINGYNSISNLPNIKENCGAFTEQSLRLGLELFIIECIKPTDKSIIAEIRNDNVATEAQKVTAEIYAYLFKHVYENVTLADVAEELFFSESYIKKVFKKETGKTIMAAFTELKIEESKKLISNGVPLSEVSDKLSFCNKNYFTKVFKKVTELTPSEYKKTLN